MAGNVMQGKVLYQKVKFFTSKTSLKKFSIRILFYSHFLGIQCIPCMSNDTYSTWSTQFQLKFPLSENGRGFKTTLQPFNYQYLNFFYKMLS